MQQIIYIYKYITIYIYKYTYTYICILIASVDYIVYRQQLHYMLLRMHMCVQATTTFPACIYLNCVNAQAELGKVYIYLSMYRLRHYAMCNWRLSSNCCNLHFLCQWCALCSFCCTQAHNNGLHIVYNKVNINSCCQLHIYLL